MKRDKVCLICYKWERILVAPVDVETTRANIFRAYTVKEERLVEIRKCKVCQYFQVKFYLIPSFLEPISFTNQHKMLNKYSKQIEHILKKRRKGTKK